MFHLLILSAILPFLRPDLSGQAPAASVPFRMDLPPDYNAFEGLTAGTWVALQRRGEGRFEIGHFSTGTPGAIAEKVAEDLRLRKWVPLLEQLEHEMKPWRGRWGGADAAGSELSYRDGQATIAVLERLVVIEDRLVLGNWMGLEKHRTAAEKALFSFVIPKEWAPSPAPELDSQKGLGAAAEVLAAPGEFEVEIDAGERREGVFEVKLSFRPYAEFALEEGESLSWALPGGTTGSLEWIEPVPWSEDSKAPVPIRKGVVATPRGSDGAYRLRYLLNLEGDLQKAAALGLMAGPSRLAVLQPAWMALPLPPKWEFDPRRPIEPPAWKLTVHIPPHMSALSWAPASEELFEEIGFRRLEFPRLEKGVGWPYFVAGIFRMERKHEREVWMRTGSHSRRPEDTVLLMNAIQEEIRTWLGVDLGTWRLVTFPECGDQVLHGMFVLSEELEWLGQSLDQPLPPGYLGSRSARLAGRLATRLFGLQIKGRGSGAPFLEASLSEYIAWRLLKRLQKNQDAANLLQQWEKREAQAGDLTWPLSLLSVADLSGPQRLLTRGPLVWMAIQEAAGEQQLDQVLGHFAKTGGYWTTEDLRHKLETVTKQSWTEFFDLYVYGLRYPPRVRSPQETEQTPAGQTNK